MKTQTLTLLVLLIFVTSVKLAVAGEQNIRTYEENKLHWDRVARRYLSFIVTQNKSRVGLEFMSKTPEEQFYLYDQLQHIQEYVDSMGKATFNDFKSFKSKMDELASYIPRGNVLNSGKSEVLARIAYRLSRLQWDMGSGVNNYQKSLGQVQLADYQEGIDKYRQLALSACDGSLFFESDIAQWISKKVSNLSSKVFSGLDCIEMVDKDLLPIISPYKDPTQITYGNATYGTSIYLASKIVPDANFPSNPIFRAFERIQKVKDLDPNKDLFSALKQHLTGLTNRELILFINAADTNFGFSFFILNAIIDLSNTEAEMLKHVKNFNNGLGHLYWLVQNHSQQRKLVSTNKLAQLPKQYHYWAGAYVTCELLHKGYRAEPATLLSAVIGLAYEAQSSGKATLKQIKSDLKGDFGKIADIILGNGDHSRKDLITGKVPLKVFNTRYNAVDDTILHAAGAVHGSLLCQ